MQWVINNHAEYNITSVNMSLSDGGNYAQNWFANDGGDGQRVTELIGQLTAMNIPVVAATGNSFNGQQGEGLRRDRRRHDQRDRDRPFGQSAVQRPATGLGDRGQPRPRPSRPRAKG